MRTGLLDYNFSLSFRLHNSTTSSVIHPYLILTAQQFVGPRKGQPHLWAQNNKKAGLHCATKDKTGSWAKTGSLICNQNIESWTSPETLGRTKNVRFNFHKYKGEERDETFVFSWGSHVSRIYACPGSITKKFTFWNLSGNVWDSLSQILLLKENCATRVDCTRYWSTVTHRTGQDSIVSVNRTQITT